MKIHNLKTKKTNAKGITLVALIVTIILLLIIAGITVATLTGDNSLITKTTDAKMYTEIAELKEKVNLKKLTDITKTIDGSINEVLETDSPYNDSLEIEDGKLVYKKNKWNNSDIERLEKMGVLKRSYDIYNDNSDTIYYIANSQTKERKYNELTNVGTLQNFRDMVNSGKFNYDEAKLIEDIKLNEGKYTKTNSDIIFSEDAEQWTPIGTNYKFFEKTLDGQMHIISGLYINNINSPCKGLFYILKGTVKNLGVINGKIVCKGNAGGIAADAREESYIYRCYNELNIETNDHVVGGIVGRCYGTIEECYNVGTVRSRIWNCAGIAGRCQNTGKIINCYNRGAITPQHTSWGSGIHGSFPGDGGTKGDVKNSYSTFLKVALSGTVEDSYYLTETPGNDTQGKTENFMKTQDFVDLLNTITEITTDEETGETTTTTKTQDVWKMDTKNINGGFPILKWQE